jgi:hypothetical protein
MARFTQGGGSSNNGGAALNYVQVAGTQQTISSAPNAIIDLDITTTGAPVQISVTGEGSNASASSWVRINLFRNNVAIGNEIQVEASAVSENVPFAINFIDDVAAGTYNYSARVTSKADGNWQFGEVAGPVMNAVELTGFKGDDGSDGSNGTNGTNGADGSDALWSFEGEWVNGVDYAAGSVVQFQGSSYYHPDGQFSSYAPPGYGWLLISAKGEDGADGADGTNGSPGLVYLGNYVSGNGYLANVAVVKGTDNNLYIATSSGGLADPVGNTAEWSIFLPKGEDGVGGSDIADFIFTNNGGDSTITLPGAKQMSIISGEEEDLYITAGDDLYLTANDDDVHIRANDDVRFVSNYQNGGTEHYWTMESDGTFTIPGSIESIDAPIVLNGSGGEFLNNDSTANNQIATIGDIVNAGSSEASFTVNGGSLGTMPTFDGAPLFSGSYVKTGPMVHFQIQVDMDNITNFGTGQYYVDLPFPAKYSYHFRDACLHDSSGTVRQYALSGHVYAGQSQVTLWFTSTSGQDELFDYNSPALLTVNDNFHISGTYISE